MQSIGFSRKWVQYIACAVVLCSAADCAAQILDYRHVRRSGFHAEATAFGGEIFDTHFVTLNFERAFFKKRNYALRAGFGGIGGYSFVPLTFSRISNTLKYHHFEYGIGVLALMEFMGSKVYDGYMVMCPLMYRYQSHEGLYFRAGFNFILGDFSGPLPTVSLGYKWENKKKKRTAD
jgi:hypothetical protein